MPFLKSKSTFPAAIVRVRSSQAAKILSLVISGAGVLLLSFGCNSGSRGLNSVAISRAEYERLQAGESGRFQPFSDGVALDTQTKQVCKTIDWHSAPARRGYLGPATTSPYENAPLCSAQSAGSRDPASVTIPRAEYERLQAAHLHRFQPFSNLAGVRLDTETGQACKTTDSPSGVLPGARGVPHTGRAPSAVIPSAYENAPLCDSLR